MQEAAFELFQLRGYRRTSVEQIARTAGFSRATFFNFFSSKAELFWVETDALIDALSGFLAAELDREEPLGLRDALLEHAGGMRSAEIPWALQHYRLIEAADDLIASGASRVLGVNRLFADYLRRRDAGEGGEGGRAAIGGEARAAELTALLIVALRSWIDAGVERGRLRDHLERAFRTEAGL
nr:helix-turn-helix domain containing protein [Leucobacter weissii]